MGRRVNRWGNLRKRQGNAHFLALVAAEVAAQVATWRAEAPAQWKPRQRELDVERLRLALHRAKSLKVDPYLVAFVIMGAEWLFRARPLGLDDIHGCLDQIEAKLRSRGLGDTLPWQASLVVGGIYPGVVKGLRRARYMVSLGEWAFPVRGWRDLVAGQEHERKNKSLRHPWGPGKPGKVPALSPIIAGLLVDSFAERAQPPGGGGRALAIDVSSILRGGKIQSGDFGVLLRAASGPAPAAVTGVPDAAPAELRSWLMLRWESAYRNCFERKRTWSTFFVEAAHNPLAVFGPLANPAVVAQLYDIAWWHDLSPRRTRSKAPAPERRPASKKAR